MAVIWVLEKPRPAAENLPDLLQGDFAVRAFASLRNFFRLTSLKQQAPDLFLIRSQDFGEELENLDRVMALQWPDVIRVYLGVAPRNESEGVWSLAEAGWEGLPFLLQQILQKKGAHKPSTYLQWGDICLDDEAQRLRILPDGPWIRLAPKELQIIRVFLKHPEHCLSHEDLSAGVWRGVKVSSSSVASHISRLRRYLGPSHCQIKSVYGGGYQLQKDVSE